MKPSRHSQWPFVLAGLTVITGVCLSLYLRGRISQTEASTARLTAETLRLNTEQELTLFADVLESVCALHALSDAVDQAAMDEFVQKGLVHQHAVLGTFGLTQRINPWLRSEIESKAKNQPGAYQVVQHGPDGTWVPAGPQPAYYPLTWQSRANGLNVPIGFDFASLGETARHTIEQIERTRRPALVPAPIKDQKSDLDTARIPHSTSHNLLSPSYWVFAPVMQGQVTPTPMQPFGNVLGFAVAVLHPEAILNRVAALAGPATVLWMTLRPALPDSATEETAHRIKSGWFYSAPLEAIGTHWIFECALPVTVTGHRSTVALAIGLIITALMSSQLLVLGNRTKKIEAEVLARTEDLRVANACLEENFHERAHMEEQMNELAARERRQIGSDLHDSLGQKLTGAVFLSRSLLNYFIKQDGEQKTEDCRSNQQPATRQTHAQTLNETLKSAVAQVRNMARGLAPVSLNNESLCEALKQLAEEMTGLYGVSCEVTECVDLPGLDRKTAEQLYLIAREAVNNAARHAQAGHILLRLTGNESAWKLCIEDNGKGLPGEQPAGECMGIRIMRHRARLIGAVFAITSDPEHGTCVKVTSNTKLM